MVDEITIEGTRFVAAKQAAALVGIFCLLFCLLVIPVRAQADPVVIVLTSGSSWTVPSDWNDEDNSIQAVGGGATGQTASESVGGYGGGGGAYTVKSNIDLTPDASISYQIGGASQDTWFKSTGDVLAKGASGQTGGQAASCVPSTDAHSGGSGGNSSSFFGGGGGGAGGPSSNGGNGSTIANINAPGGGGGGTLTTGYAAGSGGVGSQGGFGGAPGNPYGGGGGGGSASFEAGGGGAQGIIVITYTPALPPPPAPTNLITTSITGAVLLNWTAPSASPGITSYGIYRDSIASSTSLFAITTSTSTATYTDSSVVRGTNYYYRVVAVNSVGTSTYSNEKFSTSNSGRIIRLGGMRLH